MDEFGTTQMDVEGYTKWNKSGGMISFITEILKNEKTTSSYIQTTD